MKILRGIVQELTDEAFEQLLEAVSSQKESKSRQVLSLLRNRVLNEKELIQHIGISSGAFYTLKSRLLPRVVQYYTQLKESKIRYLREEAARVSLVVLNNPRMISLSFLKDLEKKLIAYDMSAELATVYKHLARLHRFDEQYEQYERLYQRHIAFSLSVVKAEDILYDFVYRLGYYHITKDEQYKVELNDLLDELENTYFLYDSHRLYTIFQIVRHYHRCAFLSVDELKMLEIEVEEMMDKLERIFARYDLDPFYGVIRNLIPLLNFEYYVRIQNEVKANFYLEEIVSLIEYQFKAHLWGFFISQFILSLITKLKQDGDLVSFMKPADQFLSAYFVEPNETSHLVIFFQYRALIAFYQKEYTRAAKIIYNLQSLSTLKSLNRISIELRLLQALMYSLAGDEELYQKNITAAKRKSLEGADLTVSVKNFAKILFLINKARTEKVETEKWSKYWGRFNSAEGNPAGLLNNIYLEKDLMRGL